MISDRRDGGFTIIELLVGIMLLSIVSISFYSVMFSGTRSSDTTRSLVRVSEEARFGLNRLIRDTREAELLGCSDTVACPTSTRFNVKVDFDGGVDADGDGDAYDNPNARGDFEDVTFAYNAAADTITLNGEVLVRGVQPIPGKQMFTYSSNFLEYDWDADGVTTWQELDAGRSRGVNVGNGNAGTSAGPDQGEISFVSSVSLALRISDGDRTQDFYAQAQLRNRR